MPIIIKYLLSAAMIVAIFEVAKRSPRMGGLVAALPVVTLIAMVWMYYAPADDPKVKVDAINTFAWYTFWYVVPTLPMFLAFPTLMNRWGFWPAIAGGVAITAVCFVVFDVLLKRFGIQLL